MVSSEEVPTADWGYPTAGKSGVALKRDRQRALQLANRHFPEAVLIATEALILQKMRGICFEAGAIAIEGYTPYTFHGFGLLLEIIRGLGEVVGGKKS